MKGYADYVFYREQYHGQMEEEDFNRHMLSATQYIRYLTMGKADQYAGEELKYAACEAADIYFSVSVSNLSKAGSGRIKSESNDGYSVTLPQRGRTERRRKNWLRGRYLLLSGNGCFPRGC